LPGCAEVRNSSVFCQKSTHTHSHTHATGLPRERRPGRCICMCRSGKNYHCSVQRLLTSLCMSAAATDLPSICLFCPAVCLNLHSTAVHRTTHSLSHHPHTRNCLAHYHTTIPYPLPHPVPPARLPLPLPLPIPIAEPLVQLYRIISFTGSTLQQAPIPRPAPIPPFRPKATYNKRQPSGSRIDAVNAAGV
jgi:hypothetical protein